MYRVLVDQATKRRPIMKHTSPVLDAVLKMTEHFHAGDIEGVMESYEERPMVVFEPGKSVEGHGDVRQVFEELFGMRPRFTYGGHQVIVGDEIAIHVAPWTMQGTGADGQPISDQGLSVAALRRQADGAWKIAIDIPHAEAATDATT